MSKPQRSILKAILMLFAIVFTAPTCLGQQATASSAELSRYDLLVQYAKTNMDLAEVELQQAVNVNAKTPGVIPKFTIERLQSLFAVAKEQFNEATMASYGGLERVRLRNAEEKIRLAKLALDAGHKQKTDGLVTPLELKRLQLKYDLAKLSRTLIQNPENFVTLLHHLEGQVNRMGEEILSLDQRITKLEPLRN
jgi:hypothetical protein